VCSRGVKLSAPSSAVRGRRPERAVVRRSWSFLICDSSASACSRSSRSCTSLAARLRSSAAAACESGVRGVAGMLPCVLFRCGRQARTRTVISSAPTVLSFFIIFGHVCVLREPSFRK